MFAIELRPAGFFRLQRAWGCGLGCALALAAFAREAKAGETTASGPGTNQIHWSFRPVTRPALPAMNPAGAGAANPIDAFIAAKLAEKKLSASSETDRRTLIRRLYLDLLGLPPTWEAVKAFAQDHSPGAYARLVEQLLASPRYGERWARHWLDVVRFAETAGFEVNTPRPNAWRYRDYVIRSFNEDKPYDRFILEQIAGDVLGEDTATGFLVAGPEDLVKSPDPVLTANQRADELHDMVSTTGSAFLGLTVGCARCHDHKFDPIPQLDYYAIKAVFEGVQHGDRRLSTPEDAAREKALAHRRREIDAIDARLALFQPLAFNGRVVLLDDELAGTNAAGGKVEELVKHTTKGDYPPGSGRGEKDDPGGPDRCGNHTSGYFAWEKVANRDLFAYEPGVAGPFRILLSWGCGWSTHAKDTRYILDADGSLDTRADQIQLALVNQQKFADGSGEVPNRPLWSGFYDAGVHQLTSASKILLRAGASDAFVSTDAIALLEEKTNGAVTLRPAVHPQVTFERFAPVAARRLRFSITQTSGGEPCLDELEVYSAGASSRNIALAKAGTKARASGVLPNFEIHRLEHINDGLYGNNHSWISSERDKGWVELEFPETVTIDRVVWGRDREQQFSDRLALEYRIEVAVGSNDWQLVASSADREPYVAGRKPRSAFSIAGLLPAEMAAGKQLLARRAELEAGLTTLNKPVMVYGGKFNPTPGPTHRLFRGDPMSQREVVEPGALVAVPVKFLRPKKTAGLSNNDGESLTENQERRLALARWIADPANPLTARVMVNRIWQYHFGEGLVSTPSDLGRNGARPTHPELLEWLAAEFMQPTIQGPTAGAAAAGAKAPAGWSLKHLHRLIVTSATYRQRSDPQPEAMAIDAGTRYLWRFPPRRLEAEPIRDAILAVSGKLDLTMGGRGFSFFEPNENYVRVYTPRAEFGPDSWRRMVYGTVVRQRPDGIFGAFDCPDGGQIAPKRNRSTTPLQALNLLNSSFILQQAGFLASRAEKEVGSDPSAQVQRVFALAWQREPDRAELEAATALVKEEGLRLFCRALLNANEFVYLF